MPLPAEIKAHSAPVHGLCASPDGKLLATAGFDGAVRLWDANSGKDVRTITGHVGPVYSVDFAPDGTSLVSCGDDRTIRIWNVSDGKSIKELKGHGGIVSAVAFSTDGKRIVSVSADKSVRTWEVADGQGKPLGEHAGSVYGLSISSDGLRLATAGADGVVKVWDLAARKEIKALKGHDGAASAVLITSTGPVSAGFDRTIRLWDMDSGKERSKLGPMPDDPYGLAVSRDGKRLAVAGYGGNIAQWELSTGKALGTHRYKSPAYCVAFASGGSETVSGHDDGFVRVTKSA